MRHQPFDYAVGGWLVTLICVAFSLLAKRGPVDTDSSIRTLFGLPALIGSFIGMVAAGIICISGQ